MTLNREQGDALSQVSQFLLFAYIREKLCDFNPLNAELNPICYLLALLAHHFLHVSRISVKSLTLRLLMSHTHTHTHTHIYIYIWSAYS